MFTISSNQILVYKYQGLIKIHRNRFCLMNTTVCFTAHLRNLPELTNAPPQKQIVYWNMMRYFFHKKIYIRNGLVQAVNLREKELP